MKKIRDALKASKFLRIHIRCRRNLTDSRDGRQFLKLVEFESKKKKKAAKEQSEYLENFTYEVQREGHALKKQLWDGNQASYVSHSIKCWPCSPIDQKRIKKDTKFLGTFEAAYKLARPLDNPGEQRGFAAMYTQSQELTKGAIDLVAKFERITKQVSDLDTIALLDNAWGEEDEALTNLLSKGKAVGIDKCRNILMNSNVEAMDPEATDAANVLFPQVKNQVSSIWGKVARKEERAVQKLVKAITLEIA